MNMISSFPTLGLLGWVLVIIILLIVCSFLICCCIDADDELITSTYNRNYQAPYDPRSDGTVDLGLMLYSSHYYNNAHDIHHNYCDFSAVGGEGGEAGVDGGGGCGGDAGGGGGGGGGCDGGGDCG